MPEEILHIQALAQGPAAGDLIIRHPSLTAHGAVITLLGGSILAMPARSTTSPLASRILYAKRGAAAKRIPIRQNNDKRQI
jgi:hypothetical protein